MQVRVKGRKRHFPPKRNIFYWYETKEKSTEHLLFLKWDWRGRGDKNFEEGREKEETQKREKKAKLFILFMFLFAIFR